MAFGPVTKDIKIAIIFRGTGKKISKDEVEAHHESVDVYWQKNARADTSFSVEWVKLTLSQAGKDMSEFILFCDCLEAQVNVQFQDEVRGIGGIMWYGPTVAADIWQLADCGCGKLIQSFVQSVQDEGLKCDENIDLCLRNSERERLTAKKRIILFTHWIGEALLKIKSDAKYDAARNRCFEKTVCLITADGSEEEKIKPEGLPD